LHDTLGLMVLHKLVLGLDLERVRSFLSAFLLLP
jgi:hypothetical protein